MATKQFPKTLGGLQNTTAHLLCSFTQDDKNTTATPDPSIWNWSGEVPDSAVILFDGTPKSASVKLHYDTHSAGKGYYGPVMQRSLMAPSFFQKCNGVTYVMQGLRAGGIIGASFIGMDTVIVQPHSKAGNGVIDTLITMILDPFQPVALQRDVTNPRIGQNNDANDWIAISLCFTPPNGDPAPAVPGEEYEPYAMIGDSRGNMERVQIFDTKGAYSNFWTSNYNTARDDSDHKHTPKLPAGLFDLSTPQTRIGLANRIGVYGGIVSSGGLTALKNAML